MASPVNRAAFLPVTTVVRPRSTHWHRPSDLGMTATQPPWTVLTSMGMAAVRYQSASSLMYRVWMAKAASMCRSCWARGRRGSTRPFSPRKRSTALSPS